ncbi:alpha-amylase family glycosyl hydrolase [Mangrovicoccus algicola]|uniref:Alpha-glucosidase n=1 Tax=Mangrovicoccus algicola TaxID=2771008 RepID=A0A8J7CGX4_9RHOB|nr:alpha-amylase family glycosyl hydrolase [Mangrovicoccus algicola]MBE3637620.1 alpha-glucosidase [Mangrovicoccus algicola]
MDGEDRTGTAIAGTGSRPARRAQDWWKGAVIYEVYLRSFRDSDGDGVGDLRGVIAKLDYIASLGVDALWLSPFYKSPMADFGYDAADYRLIDPSAGTMEDFLELRDACHRRGLRLLLDFVPAHTSEEHPWFVDSRARGPKADWYVWADKAPDGGPPNNWLSSFGGSAWSWEPRRGQYYYHPFLKEQPALNLANPDVLEQMAEQLDYWIGAGADGFRLDAVQCLGHDPDLRDNPPRGRADPPLLIGGGPGNPFGDQLHVFDRNAPGTRTVLRRLRRLAEERGAVLIGELADVVTEHVAEDFVGSAEGLHAVYDFDLINCRPDVDVLHRTLRGRAACTGGWMLNAFTNHDSRRAVSNLTGFARPENRGAAARMLLFLQLTLRGGAVIYQGDELGLPHPELAYEDILDPWAKAFWPVFEGRDGARTPFPWDGGPQAGFSEADRTWLPPAREHRGLDVATQEADPASVLSFFRAFNGWRGRQEILRRGDIRIDARDRAPVIAWTRSLNGREWCAAVNFSEDQAFLEWPGAPRQLDAPGLRAGVTPHGVEFPAFGYTLFEARTSP